LLLSLLFLSTGFAKHTLRQHLLENQARAFGSQWLELILEGKLQEAHQLTLRHDSRRSLEIELDEFYDDNRVAWENYDGFRRGQFVERLVAIGSQGHVVYVGKQTIAAEPGMERKETVRLLYRLDYREQESERSLPLLVVLTRRTRRGEPQANWNVSDWGLDDSRSG
jgi:hypothetical protein